MLQSRNLQYSNPTIGWAKKHIASDGAILIHTYIRPDLTVDDNYKWETLILDQKELDKRIAIVSSLIEESKYASPLEDIDLLEELF